MAKSNSSILSNGDMQLQPKQKNLHGSTGRRSQKSSKHSMKSNITNKIRPRRPGHAVSAGDSEGEDEDGDSSALDEHANAADEPDAFTLPGALRPVGEDTPRLAGHEIEDDMFQDMTRIDDSISAAEIKHDAEDSDDGYADVEDVSDSEESDAEEGERSVLQSAEKDLIDEFQSMEHRYSAGVMTMDMNGMAIDEDEALERRFSLQGTGDQSDEFGFPINMDEDPFFGLAQDDNLYNDMWDEAESHIWRMPETVRNRANSANSTQKRVRFEETHCRGSSTSSSEDPNEAFPDLFAASDDPMLKQRLARNLKQGEDGTHNLNNDTESFYDFEDEDEKLAFEVDEESDSDDESGSYDSVDEGDTTDEETHEELMARLEERRKATGRPVNGRPGTPSTSKREISYTSSIPSTPLPTTPKMGKGPKTGTFAIDPTRATITTDPEGRRIKVLPPSQPSEKDKAFWERAKTANSSRNNSPPNSAYMTLPSPADESMPSRPFTAESTLGSMFNGNLDILVNNDVSGIAEDLFPAVVNRRHISFTSMTTEDSDTDQQDVNMEDFIDMNASLSESDGPPSAPISSPAERDVFSSFEHAVESARAPNSGSGLLNHFDQSHGIVGSFRQNQHLVRHLSSLPAHPTKRASAHEYNALQKGKRGAANTPMTPARKKRASQDLSTNPAGIRKSVNSPLAARRPRSRGNSLGGMAHADLLQTLGRNPFE